MATATDTTPAPTAASKKKSGGPRKTTDRARAERNLGLKLAAPAAIVMLAVTAYPILYALYLSLFRYDLRAPDENAFVGLDNYILILTSGVWWQAVLATTIITVVSVVIELIIGLAFALVMHRAIFGRRTVRTSILIPYGIITVIAAFAFRFAVQPDTGFIGDVNPLGGTIGSFATVILTEVWKTTPFMSLLLLAGLATVPEELQEAAKVDGATAWQRLWKVTLPNMKGAILVALLFRALDAFRIFDTVYVQTAGQFQTQTISGLGYNALISRVNLGLGSAISILLFLMIIVIAFVFVKGFKTNLGTAKGGGLMTASTIGAERVGAQTTPARTQTTKGASRQPGNGLIWKIGTIAIVAYALFPVLWIASLSLKPAADVADGKLIPSNASLDNYRDIFTSGEFVRPLINSIGISLITTLIAVVIAAFAAYAIARLDFPGKTILLSGALAIAMFPPVSIIGPLFNIWRSTGLYDTWPGLILPYMTFALPLAIWTLAAFFREIPWDLEQAAQVDGATPYQAFRKVILPLALPGVFTSAIIVFIFCWNDFLFAISLTSTEAARTVPAATAFFTASSNFINPTGQIAAAAIVVTVPIIIMVLIFQRRIVAGLTAGAVKG